MGRVTSTNGRRRANQGPVAIIGAGPHGLAAAAHLRAAGVPTLSFGEPLGFWRHNMPVGMQLRSRKRSSNISDPRRELTIDRYTIAERTTVHEPQLTLEEFIDYGLWFQRQAVPDVDPRMVRTLAREDGGFRLELDDSEHVRVPRVVVAAGLATFGRRPPLFAGLPASLVSHTVDHADYAPFAGRRVIVVGAGQSALEAAGDLRTHGAEVEVLVRADQVRWLADAAENPPDPLAAPTDVGGRYSGWVAATPDLFRRIPARYQTDVTRACLRPAGSAWLRPRVEGVPISLARAITSVETVGEALRLSLDDGSVREVDHVVLGTGFAIDVRRYPFLVPELAAQIDNADGYPVLRPGLESSVPGLHFLGAPAARSFGPIMRFVVGTWYDAPALAHSIAGGRRRALRFSF